MESSRRTILKILVGLIGGAGVSKAGAANAISPKVDAMYRKIAETKNSFFSLEDVPGSYNAATYTWTPGRGSDGRITNASFALVPVGPWVAVVGTGFVSNIQPLLNAALPGYNDPGTGDLKMVIDAYSGIALDAAGGRLFAHGGGHHDSANNGVYRLDLAKMAWAIAKLPDMQTHWASNYSTRGTISFTVYPPAQAYANANPTTTDVYSDEFYDPGNPLANTRNPTARHTYEGMTFYGGKLRHSVRRYWEWDEATGLWSKKFPFNKTAGTHQTRVAATWARA